MELDDEQRRLGAGTATWCCGAPCGTERVAEISGWVDEVGAGAAGDGRACTTSEQTDHGPAIAAAGPHRPPRTASGPCSPRAPRGPGRPALRRAPLLWQGEGQLQAARRGRLRAHQGAPAYRFIDHHQRDGAARPGHRGPAGLPVGGLLSGACPLTTAKGPDRPRWSPVPRVAPRRARGPATCSEVGLGRPPLQRDQHHRPTPAGSTSPNAASGG